MNRVTTTPNHTFERTARQRGWLHFDLVSVLVGANSITLYYKGARDRLAAEIFHFDAEQKVSRAFTHHDIQAVRKAS